MTTTDKPHRPRGTVASRSVPDAEPHDPDHAHSATELAEIVDEAIDEPVRRPWWGPLTLAAFVGLVICSNVANAVWARWINDDPEAVLALSSRIRFLVLSVAAGIGPVWYVLIASLRIAAAFVVCHLIGRAYRQDTYRWFNRYLGVNRQSITTFENGFQKAQWIIIPWFAGSNIVAVISGVHGTRPRRLAGLLAVGIAARLALYWWLAHAFEGTLRDILDAVDRYQWWVIGASVAVVLLVNVRNFRTSD